MDSSACDPDGEHLSEEMSTGVTDEGSSSPQPEPPTPKFVCSPCSKDGVTVEAACMCVDCEENFCTQCLSYHQKFNSMIDHTIIQGEAMGGSEKTNAPVLPKERCTAHHLRGTDMFCEDHRAICCGRCIAEHHRTCKDVVYIPEAAIGIRNSEELHKTKSSAIEVIAEIKQLKIDREDDIKRIAQEKENSFQQITKFKEDIIKRMNELADAAKKEVGERFDKIKVKFEEDIKRLDELLANVEQNTELLHNFASQNESQLFVYLKKSNSLSEEVAAMKVDLSSTHDKIQFVLDESIIEYFNKKEAIGFVPVSLSLKGKYSVKSVTDEEKCDLVGCCVLENGSVIAADMANIILILLDKSYEIIQRVKLPDGPKDICAFDQDKIVVALQSKIQLAHVSDTISLTKLIDVCASIWGITHFSGNLFASCQSINTVEIRVFDKGGSLIKTIPLLVDKCKPSQLAVTGPGGFILVPDAQGAEQGAEPGAVIQFDQNGNVKGKFEDNLLRGPNCVRKINAKTMLIIGRWSNNIVQVALVGKRFHVVLGESDGIKSPYSMAYDERNHRLVVVSDETDEIAVYYVT